MPKAKNYSLCQSDSISLSKSINYIPPRLVEGKDWYILYYVQNPEDGQMRRIRVKFNRIKPVKQRRSLARKMITDISVRLQAGWNPFIQGSARKTYTPLFHALDEYLKIKGKTSETNSMRSYRSYVGMMKSFILRKIPSGELCVNQFTDDIAADLLEELRTSDTISPATYNNYIKFYKAIWNWLIEYRYAKNNPFTGFKRFPKKLTEKKRIVLSQKDRTDLIELLSGENDNYLCMCMMCYYCFLRPKEIAMLKVKDIDILKQCIYVSAEIAKNDHASVRTIPDAAMAYFKRLKIKEVPDNYYLFSWDPSWGFTPGTHKCLSRYIARYWDQFVRRQLGWGMEKQFYSLKDTGITNMLSENIAPNIVQSQADHSSLQITSAYLHKSLAIQQAIKKNARGFDSE